MGTTRVAFNLRIRKARYELKSYLILFFLLITFSLWPKNLLVADMLREAPRYVCHGSLKVRINLMEIRGNKKKLLWALHARSTFSRTGER